MHYADFKAYLHQFHLTSSVTEEQFNRLSKFLEPLTIKHIVINAAHLTYLDLSNQNLRDEDVIAFMQLMKDNTHIIKIDFSNTHLGFKSLVLLASCNQLRELNLADTNLFSHYPERAESLKISAQNTSLNKLDLSDNLLCDLNDFKGNSTLTSLIANFKYAFDEFTPARFLEDNTVLRELSISGRMVDDEMLSQLSKSNVSKLYVEKIKNHSPSVTALFKNTKIVNLSMIGHPIAGDALLALLHNRTLRVLNLSSDRGYETIDEPVVNALAFHPTITDLNVARCKLSAKYTAMLIANTRLEALDVSCNHLQNRVNFALGRNLLSFAASAEYPTNCTEYFANKIALICAHHPRLTKLSLIGMGITHAASAFSTNRIIKYLNLQKNKIDDVVAAAIISGKNNLRTLLLNGNPVENKTTTAYLNNYSLTHFSPCNNPEMRERLVLNKLFKATLSSMVALLTQYTRCVWRFSITY